MKVLSLNQNTNMKKAMSWRRRVLNAGATPAYIAEDEIKPVC